MKLVCISDTHSKYQFLDLPKGDVLIHAGDLDIYDNITELMRFLHWINKQKFRYKIVIAGNHDRILYEEGILCQSLFAQAGVIYLENSGMKIKGVNFWGSPITPTFLNWYFMRDRGDDITRVWNQIPKDTDVLITHGPPMGILDDIIGTNEHVGCYDLARVVKNICPKVHVFGHIHRKEGDTQIIKKDGTKFINASVLDDNYDLVHKPIVVEI